MSTDYTIGATIGYVFSLPELLEPFTVRTPAVFHMEQKYDKYTKLPLPPQRVTTQKASTTHVIDGQSFGKYDLDAVEKLVRVLGCNLAYNGPLNYDVPEQLEVILSTLPKGERDYFGRTSFYPIRFDPSCFLEQLMPLYEKLKAFGLEPGTPQFITYCYWA